MLTAPQVQKILLESLEKERNAPRSLLLGPFRGRDAENMVIGYFLWGLSSLRAWPQGHGASTLHHDRQEDGAARCRGAPWAVQPLAEAGGWQDPDEAAEHPRRLEATPGHKDL